MQAQEALLKLFKKIAAETHGNVPEVRTILGRQVMLFNHGAQIMQLPNIPLAPVQIVNVADPNYGKFLFAVDIDTLDSNLIR